MNKITEDFKKFLTFNMSLTIDEQSIIPLNCKVLLGHVIPALMEEYKIDINEIAEEYHDKFKLFCLYKILSESNKDSAIAEPIILENKYKFKVDFSKREDSILVVLQETNKNLTLVLEFKVKTPLNNLKFEFIDYYLDSSNHSKNLIIKTYKDEVSIRDLYKKEVFYINKWDGVLMDTRFGKERMIDISEDKETVCEKISKVIFKKIVSDIGSKYEPIINNRDNKIIIKNNIKDLLERYLYKENLIFNYDEFCENPIIGIIKSRLIMDNIWEVYRKTLARLKSEIRRMDMRLETDTSLEWK